ncbi:MAG: hypothetical protein ACQESG_06890 [Nanobdellota archaeon]
MVVAEVTSPSLVLAYEIARALELGKPVYCLYRTRRTSAMIAGSGAVCMQYETLAQATELIDGFIVEG